MVSSTIFWVLGMTRPGIEPQSPGPLGNTLLSLCERHERDLDQLGGWNGCIFLTSVDCQDFKLGSKEDFLEWILIFKAVKSSLHLWTELIDYWHML